MNLEELIDKVSNSFSSGLDGREAQYKAVPPERPRTDFEKILEKNPKQAAVLALLVPGRSGAELVFILRNTYPGVHSSQIGFPGGKEEDQDSDFWQTALRETEEELGVPPDSIQKIGQLSEVYIPPSHFLVYPFVGYAKSFPKFIPDPREVSEVFTLSVKNLLHPANFYQQKVSVGSLEYSVPAFNVEGRVIWGATAMMVSELKERILL